MTHNGSMTFGEWRELVNEGLCAADMKPIELRAAMEYYHSGYSPNEVVSIEAGEATAQENAQLEFNGWYGKEHKYP